MFDINDLSDKSPDQDWRQFASCKGMDVNDFFPERSTRQVSYKSKEVTKVCKDCPVAAQCLYEAIVLEYDGIWASTTPKQRIALRRELSDQNGNISLHACCTFLNVDTNIGKSTFEKGM